jgi:hypothetical protein
MYGQVVLSIVLLEKCYDVLLWDVADIFSVVHQIFHCSLFPLILFHLFFLEILMSGRNN